MCNIELSNTLLQLESVAVGRLEVTSVELVTLALIMADFAMNYCSKSQL